METILVTGGAGFIGSQVVNRLLDIGHQVICLDNFDPFYDPQLKERNIEPNLEKLNFHLVRGDIRNKADLEQVFQTYKINKTIHLAARAGVRPSIQDPLLYQDINIRGTLNLLELSKQYQIDGFLFASSSSVYGASSRLPFEEAEDTQPMSPYGASKRAGELFCYTYHNLYQIPITCLRFFTVYGPRQRPDMAIHKFTRLIDQGDEVPIYGDGASCRDYTYIDDIVKGVELALNMNLEYEIINLGNSKTVELKYLISLIEKGLAKKAKITRLSPQQGDMPVTYANISKARKLLNYNPQTEIELGVKKFIQWYKQF